MLETFRTSRWSISEHNSLVISVKQPPVVHITWKYVFENVWRVIRRKTRDFARLSRLFTCLSDTRKTQHTPSCVQYVSGIQNKRTHWIIQFSFVTLSWTLSETRVHTSTQLDVSSANFYTYRVRTRHTLFECKNYLSHEFLYILLFVNGF